MNMHLYQDKLMIKIEVLAIPRKGLMMSLLKISSKIGRGGASSFFYYYYLVPDAD